MDKIDTIIARFTHWHRARGLPADATAYRLLLQELEPDQVDWHLACSAMIAGACKSAE